MCVRCVDSLSLTLCVYTHTCKRAYIYVYIYTHTRLHRRNVDYSSGSHILWRSIHNKRTHKPFSNLIEFSSLDPLTNSQLSLQFSYKRLFSHLSSDVRKNFIHIEQHLEITFICPEVDGVWKLWIWQSGNVKRKERQRGREKTFDVYNVLCVWTHIFHSE